jgi:hypothetical protein
MTEDVNPHGPQSVPTPPLIIPGNDIPLPEADLLQNIGKYLALYEWEQRKRTALITAYVELKAELDALKRQSSQ